MNFFGKKQIFEDVAIALLTAIGNKIIEHFYKKLNKDKDEPTEKEKSESS